MRPIQPTSLCSFKLIKRWVVFSSDSSLSVPSPTLGCRRRLSARDFSRWCAKNSVTTSHRDERSVYQLASDRRTIGRCIAYTWSSETEVSLRPCGGGGGWEASLTGERIRNNSAALFCWAACLLADSTVSQQAHWAMSPQQDLYRWTLDRHALINCVSPNISLIHKFFRWQYCSVHCWMALGNLDVEINTHRHERGPRACLFDYQPQIYR